jgi:hypothetical protein
MAKTLPKNRVLTEAEWRGIGVQQSRGWEHYANHRPEPHILLFRRPLGTVGDLVCGLLFNGSRHWSSFHLTLGSSISLLSIYDMHLQDPVSGDIDPELEREAKEKYLQDLAVAQMRK